MLIDQLGDEPGQVLARQPIIQRRRQQQPLIRIEHPKGLVHRRLRRQRMRIYPLTRTYLEQPTTIEIIRHTQSSRLPGNQPNTPSGVLPTHAPSR